MQSEWLEVHIPPGAGDGSRIRVPECGNVGPRGGPPGDLLLKVELRTEDRGPSSVFSGAKEASAGTSTSESARFQRQQAEAAAGGAAEKPRPFVSSGERVGRNEPCPCGSGKKYKNCCGKRR